MSDEHEIANLKSRYCAAADQAAGDPEGARAAFRDILAGDVAAEYGSGPLAGITATSEFLCTAIAGNSEWMIHMLHSPRIEVTGDTARGDWTVAIRSKRRNDGSIQEVFGRYSDSYRRTENGWRIAAIDFRYYA